MNIPISLPGCGRTNCNHFHSSQQQETLRSNGNYVFSSLAELNNSKDTSPKVTNYNLPPVDIQAVEELRERYFPLARSYNRSERQCENYVELKSKSISHIRRVVVIGDSISDAGAIRSRTHGRLVPLSKYFDGRFSNGYIWPELLTAPAFLNNPKLQSGEKNTLQLLNLSEGGSTIRNYSKRLNPILHILTNLDKQIKRISKKDDANPSDLFILELGANDYMIDINNPEKKIAKLCSTIESFIKEKNVKFFICFNLPSIYDIPFSQKTNKRWIERVNISFNRHNHLLENMVQEINNIYEKQGVKVHIFDVQKLVSSVLVESKKLQYSTGSFHKDSWGYLTAKGVLGLDKKKPIELDHRFVFHDDAHPAHELHQIIASSLTDFISNNFGIPFGNSTKSAFAHRK
ncbi:SGNH/GDSL hydrolase family protein [Thalassotalea sp. G20_0]|uniref:SGNH/GDSL hydrolase family protein n=1 Tax=Thalassotalea sp. G20_0 TaxID=2821093 RepID=UPI001ADBA3FD|nr:SGNH/GDSL hydrolase family protein [Thalassotalea sp. G20_0]MBO9493757.1 SGNH/GDSL hydrolase family protein [Thalassotalea sp. G20_0]